MANLRQRRLFRNSIELFKNLGPIQNNQKVKQSLYCYGKVISNFWSQHSSWNFLLFCKLSNTFPQTNISQLSKLHFSMKAGPILSNFQNISLHCLVKDDLKNMYTQIKQELRWNTSQDELYNVATYYLDAQGKAFRPMITIIMARAINHHINLNGLLHAQYRVAMISEMVHSASLMHDDVIDQSDFRRGKPSVNRLYNMKQVTMAGDFILSVTAMMIARLRNNDVTTILSDIVTDLVQGELMQLGSRETEQERFNHYLTKTYCKTGSLIANSLKAVSVVAGAEDELSEIAYQYGRHVGIAFQLVDDLLDFESSFDVLGKPTVADLRLGLATAPVLFACEEFPELKPLIMRRFKEIGDVEKALMLVKKSQGLEKTRLLAEQHCSNALRYAKSLRTSPYQKGLIGICDLVVNRSS